MTELKDDGWVKQEGLVFWNPKSKDERLIGVIIDITSHDDFGKQYLIKTSENLDFLTPSHKVLQNRMAKAKEGDVVKIVFLGTSSIAAPGKNPAKMYDVFIKKS